jgi:hypothetical protein
MAPWALVIVPIVAVAFALRTVLVLALARRNPAGAAFVDRWWAWAPFVVVLVVVTVAAPVLGVLLAVGSWFVLTRTSAVGSPFRPRR